LILYTSASEYILALAKVQLHVQGTGSLTARQTLALGGALEVFYE
jgi:hypothetical protein